MQNIKQRKANTLQVMLNIALTKPPSALPILIVVTTVTCVRDLPPATKKNTLKNKIQNIDVYITHYGDEWRKLQNGEYRGYLSLGLKRPGSEANHSPPYSTEIKNAWDYTSNTSSRIRYHAYFVWRHYCRFYC